jgi:putative tryptophan/tyrosine transport system substrate-binding protein
VAWPLAARAQQPALPVVGVLFPDTPLSTASFRMGLSEMGFIEGRNVAIEIRFANGDYSRLPELAADLVRRRVAVIYAGGNVAAPLATKAATASIPIVFSVGADPVASGLVPRLSRPGGNLTGVAFLSTELGPKRLEFLKALVPSAMHYALLVHPEAGDTKLDIERLSAAAESIGRHIDVFSVGSIREIDAAFADLVQNGADAVVIGSSSFLSSRGGQLATLAAYHRLPAIYYNRRIVEVGGLMSYGADIQDAIRQAGIYVGRILKGEKPADLPVTQAVKFEFVINIGTARTLGIMMPPTLLALADEVIE